MKWRVILADPPWEFRNKGNRGAPSYAGRQRQHPHYQVMASADLQGQVAVMVRELVEPDAFLFLWAPHALVLDGTAPAVARSWSFEPKQEIVWVKTTTSGRHVRLGLGNFARVCTEALLLCTRGKIQPARRDLSNVLFAARGAHSAKPDESYRLIEELTGADKFLELYARRRFSERWTAWGLEAP